MVDGRMVPCRVSAAVAATISIERTNFEVGSAVILEAESNVNEIVLDSEGGIVNQSDGVGANIGPFHAPIPLAFRYEY